MATVRDMLAKKGSDVITIAPSETVLRAAELMNDRGIGGLVVAERGRPVGIFTERDILRRVVAQQRDPTTTRVADAMTSPVIACAPRSEERRVGKECRSRGHATSSKKKTAHRR